MSGGGAIVTASLNADQSQTYAFCKSLRYFTMAESLGGVESLVCHPATMTHATYSEQERAEHGISDDLLRMSIGLETLADLEADVLQALEDLPVAPQRHAG